MQLNCTRKVTYSAHTEADQLENNKALTVQNRSFSATGCNSSHLRFTQLHAKNKQSPRSKDAFSSHVRAARDVLVMKLWRPKQPDSSFRGRNEALWLCTLTIIQSVSLFVISSMCTLWQKGRKQGREKIPEQYLMLQPSSLLQPLPLSFLVASILLAMRREQTEPAQRHTAKRTLRRTGGKQKGKERRADVMEE